MATKYWGPSAGGSSTGTWDASSVTNWFDNLARTVRSTVAPTSADDVVFDAASDNGAIFTVTVGTGAVCRDITAGSLDFTMTLAGTAAWSIYGSLTFPATNFTRTYTGDITFAATTTGKTITTNGVQLTTGALVLAGTGGEWILGSAITIGGINLFSGTLRSNNFNITAANIFSSYSNVRALYLGSSTVTLSVGGLIDFTNKTNLTFDAGTSSIVGLAASPTFIGNGLTFYNVSFTSTAAGTITITGANTFNNLSVTSLAATGIKNISVGANQTINGTLTLGAANTAIRRMFVRSDVVGTPRTITLNGSLAALDDVDFRDIVAAGTVATPWTGTRLGNCLGNSNITFDAPKTVYWNLAGSQNWSATGWATTNNGTPATNNFPLAQDTATVTEAGAAGTITVDAGWNIGTLTFADGISNRTTAVTLATGTTTPNIYGDLKLFSNITLSGTGAITFAGRVTQNITSAGKTITQGINVDNATGIFKLADALISSATTAGAFTLTSGNLNLNGFDLTCAYFGSANSNIRTITFGANKIIVTGNNATIVNFSPSTNFSYTGTGLFDCNYSGSVGSRQITGATNVTETNAININFSAGLDSITTSSGHTYKSINFSGFTGSLTNTQRTLYGNLTVSSGMTISAGSLATIFAATSGSQLITSNGKTLDIPITKDGAGTLQLQDALTMGSTRTFTHTTGSVDLNAKTLTVGAYSTTGAVARDIKFGTGGSIVDLGAWTASGSNLTTSGTGSISMTSASAKTFAGGGFSYPTLNQGGAGDLTITGANRFKDMTNTVQPCAVVFPASTITSVENFSLNGTPGNLVSIRSSVAGTRFTLNKVAP